MQLQQSNSGPGHSPWMAHATAPQTFDTSQMARSQVPGNPSQPGPGNVEPSPSHLHAPLPGNQVVPQGVGSLPRSVSASQQHLPNGGGMPPGPSPFPSQPSPNLPPQFPSGKNNGTGSPPDMYIAPGLQATPSGPFPPPLEKPRFDSAYKNWAMSRNLKHDMRLMSVEGRNIDLYALHTHVMNEGGWSKVRTCYLTSAD